MPGLNTGKETGFMGASETMAEEETAATLAHFTFTVAHKGRGRRHRHCRLYTRATENEERQGSSGLASTKSHRS